MKKVTFIAICLLATVAHADTGRTFWVVKENGLWKAKDRVSEKTPNEVVGVAQNGSQIFISVKPEFSSSQALLVSGKSCEAEANYVMKDWNVVPSCIKSGTEISVSFERKDLTNFKTELLSPDKLPDDNAFSVTVMMKYPTQTQQPSTSSGGGSDAKKAIPERRDHGKANQ